jgi:hypothetical protein
MAVLLLCVGVCLILLSLPAGGSRDPFALGRADVPPADQWTNANALPLYVPYCSFDRMEEEENPVNAELLTTLFLAASCFGAGVGWLRDNAQGQRPSYFFSLGVVGEVLSIAREDYLAFLEVFRL